MCIKLRSEGWRQWRYTSSIRFRSECTQQQAAAAADCCHRPFVPSSSARVCLCVCLVHFTYNEYIKIDNFQTEFNSEGTKDSQIRLGLDRRGEEGTYSIPMLVGGITA